MVFKQVQGFYFSSIAIFIGVFFLAKEIANYTTKKETNNKWLRFICFSKEPLPLVTIVLIMIDYIGLAMIIAFNFVSLFLSENCALVLMLICNGVFLAFACVAGEISRRIKKQYEYNI